MSTYYKEEVHGEEVVYEGVEDEEFKEEEEFMADEQELTLYEVDYIHIHRGSLEKRNLEYFVHWKGYPDFENSWVSAENMACPELIGEYYDRLKAQKLKKRRVSAPGSSSTSKNEPAVHKERTRGKTVTTSVMKAQAKSTSHDVPKELEPVPAPENEQPPLKISRSSLSTATKETTVLAEDSPSRRKVPQQTEVVQAEQEIQPVQPQISQLRISEEPDKPSLVTTDTDEDEEDEPDTDYSDSDLETSDSETGEQNDDDISDIEDYQKQKEQKASLRPDKKNGYEKGMKGETLISFVKKGEVISGLVKFEGSNKLEIIPYAKLRIFDPALVARYHVNMLLRRNSSDSPPQEGLIKGLQN